MAITVECSKCGHVRELNTDAIVRGDWRQCPVCTPSKPPETETDVEPVTAALERSEEARDA